VIPVLTGLKKAKAKSLQVSSWVFVTLSGNHCLTSTMTASDIATVHGDCIFDLLSGKQLHDNEVLV